MASAASLCVVPTLYADTFNTTSQLSLSQLSLVATQNANGVSAVTTIAATNVGTQTLNNIYFFSTDFSVNRTILSLTAPGDYTSTGPALFSNAENAAVFTTPSETNVSLDAQSSGSSTIPEIPGFLITGSLTSGQTVDFIVAFELPSTAGSLSFNGFDTATVTPESSSVALSAQACSAWLVWRASVPHERYRRPTSPSIIRGVVGQG